MAAANGESRADPAPVPARFEVLEDLSQGGGPRLLRARDTLLLREVLLKVPTPAAAPLGARGQERALREARALACIHHPAVQRLIDVVETPAGPLLVLEPAAGETLAARRAREGRLVPGDVVALGIALAQALEVVHAANVMHRGLCAECILLGEGGRVTLTGFEFAKPTGHGERTSTSSLALAPGSGLSPAHLAPEQQMLHQDDPRSDVFGLGWVLYECLTGEAPYPGSDPRAWTTAPDARARVPEAPLALTRLLALCLSLSPAQRPQDVRAVLSALEGLAPAGRRTASAARTRGRVAWTGLAAAAAAALLYLGLGGPLPALAAKGERGVFLGDVQGPTSASGARAGGAPVLSARYAHSYALLIGIGEAYQGTGFPALPNAERDVEAVASAMRAENGVPWDIRILRGQEARQKPLVQALVDVTERTQPDDRVLIYFAGHGIAHGAAADSGFVVPADGVPDRQATWVRFSEFTWPFKESQAKHILVAMDCCYGGRLTGAMRGGSEAYAERFLTAKAHVVISSGRPNERVSDGKPGTHSPFASAFVAALGAGDGPLTSTGLFGAIEEAFTRDGVGHTPVLEFPEGGGGEFVFFRGGK